MSEHGTERQYKKTMCVIEENLDMNHYETTSIMEKIGLYYKEEKSGCLCFFWETSAGKFNKKRIRWNKIGILYIRHKNCNYSLYNLQHHIETGEPLKKGTNNKYTPRKRNSKLSLFDRLMNWFRSIVLAKCEN